MQVREKCRPRPGGFVAQISMAPYCFHSSRHTKLAALSALGNRQPCREQIRRRTVWLIDSLCRRTTAEWERISFLSPIRSGQFGVYLQPLDDDAAEPLVTQGYGGNPRVTPDGKWLLYRGE